MNADAIARDRVREADEFMASGATYSGFIRLGEVLRFVLVHTGGEARESWRETILKKARQADLATVRQDAISSAGRISRLLSTSGAYDIYDIVLLLTLRIQLESAESLLAALGHAMIQLPPSVDDDIRALRAAKQNRQRYQTALGMLRRNWGFPIESVWLAP